MNAVMHSQSVQVPQMQATFKGSLKPLRAVPAARRAVATRAVCSAEAPKVGTALAAAALAAALSLGSVQAAHADIAGLTPCSESKGFAKRQKKEITSLQKRLKQYDPTSAPALALTATIERTEKRFANYSKQGLLCGNDGLPHLIADPGLALRYGHAGEVLVRARGHSDLRSIPTIGFLYIAGWIGYVGRQYLIIVKGEKKPFEKEIIIDVPLALRLSLQGAAWPLKAVRELQQGSLVESQENITVSPR